MFISREHILCGHVLDVLGHRVYMIPCAGTDHGGTVYRHKNEPLAVQLTYTRPIKLKTIV